jgi:outer membrane lipoprotein-sorting protein
MRYLIFFLLFFSNIAYSKDIDDIIQNFNTINNIKFDFTQTTSGIVETGNCIIVYSNKMRCVYDGEDGKEVLVKDSHLYVVKHKYKRAYPYPIKNSIFSILLDKNKILENLNQINKIEVSNNKIVLEILTKDQEYAKIFFDKKTKMLKGWETISFNQEKVNFDIGKYIINSDSKEEFIIPDYPNH